MAEQVEGQSPDVRVVCLESVARGGICGAGAERAGPACDAGEVAVPGVADDDGVVGAGVPAVGEERSQWKMEPSELPGTRTGCMRCHARAISW